MSDSASSGWRGWWSEIEGVGKDASRIRELETALGAAIVVADQRGERIAELEALLRELEWSELDDTLDRCICPVCYADKHKAGQKHHPECELAKALGGGDG